MMRAIFNGKKEDAMKKKLLLGLMLALGIFAQQAQAQIYVNLNNVVPFIAANVAPAAVPIGTGGIVGAFVFSATAKPVIIAYNAECAVQGPAELITVDIDIVVNGAVIAPTATGAAFCSSDGGVGFGSFVNVISHVVATLQPGFNAISVNAARVGGPAGALYSLANSKFTVWD
jgi:hypothetical protein